MLSYGYPTLSSYGYPTLSSYGYPLLSSYGYPTLSSYGYPYGLPTQTVLPGSVTVGQPIQSAIIPETTVPLQTVAQPYLNKTISVPILNNSYYLPGNIYQTGVIPTTIAPQYGYASYPYATTVTAKA
ncbi:hypothetical protein GUITHDRAFT_141928 [Guillardia theta CCMP2712]|uniref:Uncharacterized protein n=1 Tax=Guillardia theta (strain CCMP2712) TaxID=905079 RepID=L1J0M7_GUITC|nr:hypothetical protein GUITHDRAFT_141928 [Guillardia theta CCMP2712]EKX41694.1 hypothetical protein GUITHDRAFT_141928 [Guillardia theta CCMP2712]|eukprot:XP_005828674.1 hypothetical protein GUITHDRAFT_141928 [Guillardia theta CCMP2712]